MTIHVAIKGGLGNQLFQYALGSYLQKKYNTVVCYDVFPLDTQEENLTPRDLVLDQLFPSIRYTEKRVHKLFQHDASLFKWYKKFWRTIHNYRYISETHPLRLKLKKNAVYYLDGYWQRADIAETLADTINAQHYPALHNSPYYEAIHAAGESVALHIRRGDYVSNAFINSYHGNCDLSYYQSAMQRMEEKTNVASYFVFSDDMNWARQYISSPKPVVFVDNQDAVTDLLLMKSCRHQIISNSSFSCWATYLNSNPHKVVIAPVNWTKTKKTNTLPLFDNTWILL